MLDSAGHDAIGTLFLPVDDGDDGSLDWVLLSYHS